MGMIVFSKLNLCQYAGRRAALGPAPAATVSLAIFSARFRERRQQTASFNSSPPPPASVLRTRILLWPLAALRLPPAKYSPLSPVAAFAFSALRLRLRFGSPCGGRRRAAGTASGRHHARATDLFLPIRRHHPPRQRAETGGGSCLVIATRRLLPEEGVGLACLRLTVQVRP